MHSKDKSPYYLDAFVSTIQEAVSTPKHSMLLTDQEKQLAQTFLRHSSDLQRLYVRLFMRKSQRSFKLAFLQEHYQQEFPAFATLIASGIEGDLFQFDKDYDAILRQSLNRIQLCNLYHEVFPNSDIPVLKESILERFAAFDRARGSGLKPLMKQTKLCFTSDSNQIGFQVDGRKRIADFINSKFGQFVQLKWQKEFYQICLIVLLPAVCKSSLRSVGIDSPVSPATLLECVTMYKLGKIQYPSFVVDTKCGLFTSRKSFDEYIELLGTYEMLQELVQASSDDVVELAMYLLPEIYEQFQQRTKAASFLFDRFTCDYVIGKILTLIAGLLEREKMHKMANIIYKTMLCSQNEIFRAFSCRDVWWSRLLINTRTHLKDEQEFLQTLCSAWEDPSLPDYFRDEQQKSKDENFPVRELEMADDYVPAGGNGGRVTLLNQKGATFTVENYVLDLYEDEGWQGLHDEGSVFVMVTVLLCWDVLFDSSIVPTAFQSPFQSFPLDLFTAHFYPKRKEQLENHLRQFITNPITAIFLLETNYFKYKGISAVGMNWNIHWEACEALVSGMNSKVLVSMMQQLLQDFRHNSSGLPDLFMWRSSKPGAQGGTKCEICFIEVKSHNDQLSGKQVCWIRKMLKLGITVQVVKIKRV